jgi:hypothetical protein
MRAMNVFLPAGWRWARLGEVGEINPRRPRLMSRLETDGGGYFRGRNAPCGYLRGWRDRRCGSGRPRDPTL